MFPIRDTIPSRRTPVVTLGLIIANVLIFLYQLALPPRRLETLFYLFGIVPLRYTHPEWAQWVGFPADSYWPFLTSMFLHGGWLHLITNMWTLWIFGDNVEDRMGPWRFLLFYIGCGILSGVVHLVTNASSPLPTIGASGAIAGVLGAYFLLFPLARVICIFPILFYPLFLQLPAFIYLLIWFSMQFFSGTLSLLNAGQAGGIAWWAHIGGFAVGMIFYRFFLDRDDPRRARRRRETPVHENRL